VRDVDSGVLGGTVAQGAHPGHHHARCHVPGTVHHHGVVPSRGLAQALRRALRAPEGPSVRYPDDIHDVTGIDKYAMERISLLRDAPYEEGSSVSQQKDPLGNYQRPDVRRPTTEIPPITEFQDGTPIRTYKEVVPMDALENEFMRLPLDKDEHARQFYYPDAEEVELPLDTEWLSLAKSHIPQAVTEYIHLLETGETRKWCKCPWIVHPDDANVPEGVCVHCGKDQDDNYHDVGAIIPSDVVEMGWHRFQGRRIRRDHNNQHAQCPVHTKEGLILGFFEHLFGDQDEAPHTSGT